MVVLIPLRSGSDSSRGWVWQAEIHKFLITAGCSRRRASLAFCLIGRRLSLAAVGHWHIGSGICLFRGKLVPGVGVSASTFSSSRAPLP